MSQLSISSSNFLPMGVPLKATARDLADAPPPGQFASRQYLATTDNSAAITVETAEGDKVTLNYNATTAKKNYIRQAGTEIPGLEESLATHREMTVNIEGELSEQEKAEITAFKQEVSVILDDYFAANSKISGDQLTLDLSKYQALGKYAMALDSSSSTSWATEMVAGVARPSRNNLEVARQQRADISYSNNRLSTLAVSEDQEITKQDSSLQFDYAATRMQLQSARVEGQNSLPPENREDSIQSETSDHPLTNPPDYTELREATQEIFAQQVSQLRDESKILKIKDLERDFGWLMDQLTAREKETVEQGA